MTCSRFSAFIGIVGWLSGLACGGGPEAPMTPAPPPDFAGAWTGTYRVSSCSNSGFFADAALCSTVLDTTASVTFTLAQSDRTVTGSFSLGTLNSPPVTSPVSSDGSLTLAAQVRDGVFTIDTTWTLLQPSPGTLAGQTRQVWTASGQSGEAVVQGSIVSVTRTISVRLASTPSPDDLIERPSEIVDGARLRGQKPGSPGGEQAGRVASDLRRLIGYVHLHQMASGR